MKHEQLEPKPPFDDTTWFAEELMKGLKIAGMVILLIVILFIMFNPPQ